MSAPSSSATVSYEGAPEIAAALDLGRAVEVSPDGIAIGGDERIAIHKAHRIGAVLVFAAILAAALMAYRKDFMRKTAMVVLTLLIVEFSIGITSVMTGLPIFLAVAHNWLAALLLLGMIKLLALTRDQPGNPASPVVMTGEQTG